MNRTLLVLAALINGPLCANEPKVPVTALAFSPDGKALLSNGPQRVDVRSTEDGSVQSHFACDLPKITSLAFHPQGEVLAAAGGEPGVRGGVLLFDWPSQKQRRRIECPDDVVSGAAFSPDGKLLGTAGADHVARVWRWNDDSNAAAFILTGHAGPVLSIAFSPNGNAIVTASADRSIKVWSAKDGSLLRTFTHHLEAVNAVAFRPATAKGGELPSVCASASDDRTVRVWQPESGRMVRIVRGHRKPVLAVVYAADGRSLFSAGQEGIIRCFDAESDTLTAEWKLQSDWIYSLAASPDGKKLAAGDWSGAVRILSLETKK